MSGGWGGPPNRVGESSAGGQGEGAVSQDNTPPHVRREDRSLSLGQADQLGVGTGSLPPTGEPWAKTGQGSKIGEVTAPVLPGGQDLGVCEHPGCHLPVGVLGHFPWVQRYGAPHVALGIDWCRT